MPRLKQLQKSFLKGLLCKMLFFPTIWFFFWAIYPLASSPYLRQGFDPLFYIMLSLFNWLLFTVSLIGAAALEMLIANPELRRSLTHIERGKPRQPSEQKTKEEKKQEKIPLF